MAYLLQGIVPRRRLGDVQLSPEAAAGAAEVVEEYRRAELLHSHGIEPRNRILLDGPPGNGKTSLAEVIAAETLLPLYVVRYEGVVSSFLGETAAGWTTCSSSRVPAPTPHHRQQVIELITEAQARGLDRLVEMNQQVLDNLDRIFDTLDDGPRSLRPVPACPEAVSDAG